MPGVRVGRVSGDLYVLRLDDDETKLFEALWSIPEGITYNSYVLVTGEGVVVFDTWKREYSDLFLEALQRVVDLRDVKYLVLHHMEPDHSGSVPRLLEAVSRGVRVISHPMSRGMLEAFYGLRNLNFHAIRDLEVIEVGGARLKFIYTPWLHWPETIMTFVEDLGVLLSCDAFGSYSIPSGIFDDDLDLDRYSEYVREYFATVLGSLRHHVVRGVEKVLSLNLEVKVVAPGHGVVWRRSPQWIIDYYLKLARGEAVRKGKVTVVYDSMYGFVGEAVEKLVEKLRGAGLEVKVYSFTDRGHAPLSEVLGDALDSEVLVLGVSTYENDLFPATLHAIDVLRRKITTEKPVVALLSYGWGSPKAKLLQRLESSSLRVVEVVEFKGRASDHDVEKAYRAVLKALGRA